MPDRLSLTLEDVARYPRPALPAPSQLTVTPDDRFVLFIWAADGLSLLWVEDTRTGARLPIPVAAPLSRDESALPLAEQLRRERERVRETGITRYQMVGTDNTHTTLLVPIDGALAAWSGPTADLPTARLLPLPSTADVQDARLSPDARTLAFVADNNLCVAPLTAPADRRVLTSTGAPSLTNGLADYIAQEEMGRQQGYWWSVDSQWLAYIEADSRHIPLYTIPHQGTDILSSEEHHYPFAGQPNPATRLGLLSVDGGPTRWVDLGDDPSSYIARVAWAPAPSGPAAGRLMVQVQTRDQRSLRLVAVDATTGQTTTLCAEYGAPWLNLSDAAYFLANGQIVWPSERSGFRHLSLYSDTGQCIHSLTSGSHMVTELVGVDEERRLVYYQSTDPSPVERHIWVTSLDAPQSRRVTTQAGWHTGGLTPSGRFLVISHSAIAHPPTVAIVPTDVQQPPRLLHAASGSATPLGIVPPTLFSFPARDGTLLHAALYAPTGYGLDEPAPSAARLPLIVAVYGGPHHQSVTNTWGLTVDLRAQYLAQNGFAVLKVDNRGSAGRGLAFEAHLSRRMGSVEVEDQVAGVRWLCAHAEWVDPDRVGIYGWSYGGYMTLRCLLRAPNIFRVGVAGAPVTAWDGYDTHYTERYMGTLADNPAGYRESAVLTDAATLQGKLLLVHGLVDENVHFRHTARLLTVLNRAHCTYDLLLFPEERHMPRAAADLLTLEARVIGFLRQHLGRTP